MMKKKVISIALVLALALSLAAMSGCGSSKVVLNVYNWGMNIAEGEDGRQLHHLRDQRGALHPPEERRREL